MKRWRKYRFSLQRHNYDCGPVALCNILKFCGRKINYSDVKEPLIALLKAKPHGCSRELFYQILKYVTSPFELIGYKKQVSFSAMRKFLLPPNRILVLGVDTPSQAHVALVLRVNRKSIYLVNWSRKQVIKRYSHKQFGRYLKQWNICYIIEKRG